MGRLIYGALCSLDGYTEDASGSFDWAAPDEEVHAFVNDLERPVGTYLYGRRMYETMSAWETMPTGPDESPATNDYAAIWRNAAKVVFSSTLKNVQTPKTRIERVFVPEDVAKLKANEEVVSIGGPALAVSAFEAGLIDEVYLFLQPVSVGGGKRALPTSFTVGLQLLEQRRFESGVVYLKYAVNR